MRTANTVAGSPAASVRPAGGRAVPARAPGGFAALARRRPDLVSAHFSLSWACVAATAAPAGARAHAVARPIRAGSRQTLALAVGKRFLARAVDRNAMKRVAREAWRAHAAPACPAPAVAQGLLRLRSADRGWASMSAAMRKRAWRDELDALLARMSRAAAQARTR